MSTEPIPIAPETKPPRCELNAFRHGVTGQVIVMSADDSNTYKKHCGAIHGHYQPAGPIEESLVDFIASTIWRIERSIAVEEGIFSMGAANRDDSQAGPAYTFVEQEKALKTLNTYENRLRRALERDKAELHALQSARKEQAARDMDQAVALHNLAKSDGKPYEPEQYFPAPHQATQSVFSREAVQVECSRREALTAAQARLKSGLVKQNAADTR